ncbi:MAG: DUF983 domain-containing protein [Gemmataceae bacterium]|nr:DUF983 domain-containing protein [Gemmataceae bacterium]
MSSAGGSRFWAILSQRCPRCLQGRVFRGAVEMNPSCPVCGLPFEREEGYFLGAMYISYALSIVFLGLLTWVASLLLPKWDLGTLVLVAVVAYLPFVARVFRYSRVIWIHFDRWAWPGRN